MRALLTQVLDLLNFYFIDVHVSKLGRVTSDIMVYGFNGLIPYYHVLTIGMTGVLFRCI